MIWLKKKGSKLVAPKKRDISMGLEAKSESNVAWMNRDGFGTFLIEMSVKRLVQNLLF